MQSMGTQVDVIRCTHFDNQGSRQIQENCYDGRGYARLPQSLTPPSDDFRLTSIDNIGSQAFQDAVGTQVDGFRRTGFDNHGSQQNEDLFSVGRGYAQLPH